MSFYVFKCPECGKWQACDVKRVRTYTFKCRLCDRSAKVWQERRRGVWMHHYGPMSERDASEKVSELNGQRGEAGFLTYG